MVGELWIVGLAGNLLGFELAIESFEDPLLQDVPEMGLDFAEDETQAGGASIEDYCFGLEMIAGIANLEQHEALHFEGS